jgi:hypothetical protein
MEEQREDRRMQMQMQQQFMGAMMMMMMGGNVHNQPFVSAYQANMPPPPANMTPPPTIPPMDINQTNTNEDDFHSTEGKSPEE